MEIHWTPCWRSFHAYERKPSALGTNSGPEPRYRELIKLMPKRMRSHFARCRNCRRRAGIEVRVKLGPGRQRKCPKCGGYLSVHDDRTADLLARGQ